MKYGMRLTLTDFYTIGETVLLILLKCPYYETISCEKYDRSERQGKQEMPFLWNYL